jgi:hypothetical protein
MTFLKCPSCGSTQDAPYAPGDDCLCGDKYQEQLAPNPGTKEAIAAGCQCPAIDNCYGRGYRERPGEFIYVYGCPVHPGKVTKEEVEAAEALLTETFGKPPEKEFTVEELRTFVFQLFELPWVTRHRMAEKLGLTKPGDDHSETKIQCEAYLERADAVGKRASLIEATAKAHKEFKERR